MSGQDEALPQPQIHPSITPRSSLGSAHLSSYSSASSTSPSSGSSANSSKSALSECLGAWFNYLQILNNLCASGYKLSQTILALEPWSNKDVQQSQTGASTSKTHIPQSFVPFQFITAWDDLARATAIATSTVKSHIVYLLQDFITQSFSNANEQEAEIHRIREHNQQIVQENVQTMINLQHQFCIASYDSFAQLINCYQCQSQSGYQHDVDCGIMQSKLASEQQRSQTPPPHFQNTPPRVLFDHGSGSTHASSSDYGTHFEHPRGPSPIQRYLDNIKGPLPNPGHLLGMKAPFYRGSRSPLNFPLFPLNGQRRWSEAAAGEVTSEIVIDAESQMRRWSMPWEAKSDKHSTVHWSNPKILPISKLTVPATNKGVSFGSAAGSTSVCTEVDRSLNTTPDGSLWHSSVASQDGLAEAIQLLSCRPTQRMPVAGHPGIGTVFMEESHSAKQGPAMQTHHNSQLPHGATIQQPSVQPPPQFTKPSAQQPPPYGIWSTRNQDRFPPFMKFIKEQKKEQSLDENQFS